MPCARSRLPQVQIIRIQLRVPEYGWTTQKVGAAWGAWCSCVLCTVCRHALLAPYSCTRPHTTLPSPSPAQVFHLLNFLVCGLRSSVFALRYKVEQLPYSVVQAGLLDLPGEQRQGVATGLLSHCVATCSCLCPPHVPSCLQLPRLCRASASLPHLLPSSRPPPAPARPAVLLHLHPAGAVLGGDLLPGPLAAHRLAAPRLCGHEPGGLCHPGGCCSAHGKGVGRQASAWRAPFLFLLPCCYM